MGVDLTPNYLNILCIVKLFTTTSQFFSSPFLTAFVRVSYVKHTCQPTANACECALKLSWLRLQFTRRESAGGWFLVNLIGSFAGS